MMPLTNKRFAQSTAGLARLAASWTRDILDADASAQAKPRSIERFISEIQEHLDHLSDEASTCS
jgi:hypothetical protein